MNFRFDHPELLALLLLAGPIVWLGMRSLATLEPARRWTAIALRLAVLTMIVFMLAGLQGVTRHSDLTVVVVRDTSESVRRLARPPTDQFESTDAWLDWYVHEATGDKRQSDRLGLVTYDRQAAVRVLPGEVEYLDLAATVDPRDGTDSASGLRSGLAILPGETASRLLLISDGNETVGDLIAAAKEAAAVGVKVDVLPIQFRLSREVMVDAVYAPTDAREGQTAGVRVVLRATNPTSGSLLLFHDDQAVGSGYTISESDWSLETDLSLDPVAQTGARYIAVKQIDLPLSFSGVNRFRAVFEPQATASSGNSAGNSGGDTVSVNNRAEAFTLVDGEGRILLVNNVPGRSGQVLPAALRSRGLAVDEIDAYAMPTNLGELQRYDAVIFQNVPQEQITLPQQNMIARYVNDMGGGFLMVGGTDSFAAGAWTNTPIDRILPVECQIPSQAQLPSGALVLVIDRSGSMTSPVAGSNRSQQELANEAAVLALSTLFPQDLVGVVVFDSDATWVVKLQPNNDPAGVASVVRSVQPMGGTNIYSGLLEAYKALAPMRVQDAAVRHVILLTDGQSTPPPGGSYTSLVRDMVMHDISLSTIGVGDGHDAALLNQLAMMGNGTYHPIKNPNVLPQVFIKEAKTIRKNLIKELLFTPTLHNTGSPIMSNIAAVPQLRGFVLTGPKHDPRVFMPMTGPEDEPIFAHWQVGLGRSAAFTSDATNRWAVDWLNWDGYADFWARTLRTIARPAQSRNADLLTDINGGVLNIRLDAETADQDGTQFSKVVAAVIQPDGSAITQELPQTGPGLYEISLPAEQSGSYVVRLFMQQPDGSRQQVYGGVSSPPGAELRRFTSNLPLLEQVAQITGGRLLDPNDPSQAHLYQRDQEYVSRTMRPLWRSLLIWLLVLLLLDVACRRIAWDPAAIAAWFRARWRILFARREVAAEATLAALKTRRAQVRADRSENAGRKFEASADFQAADDLAAAVGGAKESDTHELAPIDDNEAEIIEDDASTTSRLLAAKRRVRTQQGEKP
ncbi:MAG: VWA domain-containing protein [Phycisphaeraceae bacterium]|nr:VWA domain-containing protein [Phycisphaeraceae bacterium]